MSMRNRIDRSVDIIMAGRDNTYWGYSREQLIDQIEDGIRMHLSKVMERSLSNPNMRDKLVLDFPAHKIEQKKQVIGLHGEIGSGKDAASETLVKEGWRRAAFADPLRFFASAVFNIPRQLFENRETKELKIPELGVSPRHVLRILGSDICRAIDPDMWVKRMHITVSNSHSNVVITDVRMDNEAAYVRRHGTLIHVVRPSNPYLAHMSTHSSDVALAKAKKDIVITNDGSIAQLHLKIHESCIKVSPANKRGPRM